MDIKIILQILGAILSLIAVIIIFDARKIVKTRFSFGDQNGGTLILKVSGLIMFVLGMILIFINL